MVTADPRAIRRRVAAERRTLGRPAAGVRRGLCVRDADRERHGEDAAEAGRALRRHRQGLARGDVPGVLAAASPLESLPEPHPVQAVVGDVEAHSRQYIRPEGAGRARDRDRGIHPRPDEGHAARDAGRVRLLPAEHRQPLRNHGIEHRRAGERDRARPDELPVPSAGRHCPAVRLRPGCCTRPVDPEPEPRFSAMVWNTSR
jgi:hypothetical protein